MGGAAERVQIVQEGMAAYARGDMAAVLARFDDDLELYSPPELGNSPAGFRGPEGYLEWVEAWLEAWEEYTVEVVKIEPVGERHVVADCHQRAIGKGSGIPVEFNAAYMWEVPGERATAFHLYRSWDDAIAAATAREAKAANGDG
jgi:ketosteroid isomerase-like protein